MDRVGVQCDIRQVEADTTHVLFANRTLLGAPLEGTVYVLLDFRKILNGNRRVNDDICTISLRTPAPDFACLGIIPIELFTQETRTLFRLSLGSRRSLLNF